MIRLRDCPMCRAKAAYDDVQLLKTSCIDLEDGTDLHEVGFSVCCINCGAKVSHECRDTVICLWNGEPPPKDKDEEGDE